MTIFKVINKENNVCVAKCSTLERAIEVAEIRGGIVNTLRLIEETKRVISEYNPDTDAFPYKMEVTILAIVSPLPNRKTTIKKSEFLIEAWEHIDREKTIETPLTMWSSFMFYKPSKGTEYKFTFFNFVENISEADKIKLNAKLLDVLETFDITYGISKQGVIYAKDSIKVNNSCELIRVGTTRVIEDRLISIYR